MTATTPLRYIETKADGIAGNEPRAAVARLLRIRDSAQALYCLALVLHRLPTQDARLAVLKELRARVDKP